MWLDGGKVERREREGRVASERRDKNARDVGNYHPSSYVRTSPFFGTGTGTVRLETVKDIIMGHAFDQV